MIKQRIRLLNHTADIGVSISAHTISELISLAGVALYRIMVEHPEKIENIFSRSFIIHGSDYESLMINFLNTLISYSEIKHIVFSKFTVRLNTKKMILHALCQGEMYTKAKHGYFTEVKAATFYKLKIEHKKNKFIAHIIFDI